VTFKVASDAPSREQLQLGGPALDGLTVAEIGIAELISAEGELPWTPDAGASYEYADLTSGDRRFATIDYSEEPPVVFKGVETTLPELGITGGEIRATRAGVVALNCPSCGGALTLQAPDQAERVWCPYCGAGSNVSNGKLKFFKKLEKKPIEPVIALGAKGTIDGDEYVVAGFMQRAVTFDQDYFWIEYLLFNRDKGFRWLVESDYHWSFVTPLRPGEVQDPTPLGHSRTVHYDGREYKIFQTARARVTYVVGEFYWKVMVDERVDTVDYVSPPFGISKEITTSGAQEIAYSHARYMTGDEVSKAFGLGRLRSPYNVGPMQPFTGPKLLGPGVAMIVLLLIAAIFLAFALPNREVLNHSYDLGAEPPILEGTDPGRVIFSEPFELSGNSNLEISTNASIDNSWVSVVGDLVEEKTSALYSFETPLEYYSGYEDGEHWSEGSRQKTVHLSRPDKGRYTLRLETMWEHGKMPPTVTVRIREGVFRWPYFILAFVVIAIFPVGAVAHQLSFESQRWKEANPYGELGASDDSSDYDESDDEEE